MRRFLFYKLIYGTLALFVLGMFYFIIGTLQKQTAYLDILSLSLDYKIPYIEISSWYYVFGLYAVFPYTLVTIKTKVVLKRALWAALLTGGISFIFFYFFPVSYLRPTLDESGRVVGSYSYEVIFFSKDFLSPYLMKTIYTLDSSINTFPSLHLGYVAVFAATCWDEKRKYYYLFLFNIIFTYISTLTTKQHFIVDGVAGILLGTTSYYFVKKVGGGFKKNL